LNGQEDMRGRYLNLSEMELARRAEAAWELYRECRVCPHTCGVDRLGEGRGICRQGAELAVSAAVAHFGEEPPLVGSRGVGNVFVTSCNLRCDYCQNFQISQEGLGEAVSFESAARAMLELERQGVHFIGWVSPSHVVPGLLRSLVLARRMGLTRPIVYNSNGYDQVSTLRLLDGIVDVYLPDLKYADAAVARRLSHIDDYPDRSRSAVLEMFRQVGPLTVDSGGLARSGLLVRHLVLPEGLAGTWETLCFVVLELSPAVPVSLMSQYRPVHKAGRTPELNRAVTVSEYEEAVRMARELGLGALYVQDPEQTMHNLPDFSRRESPFPLDRPAGQETAGRL
jgi:putative pyruvate formate lyase activating enzyme